MHKTTFNNSEYAVSEIVGGLILVLIAFVVIAAIYMYVFPLPIPPAEPNIHIAGYVDNQGNVVLEHMGGETLSSYEVYIDGVLDTESTGKSWEIGQKYLPKYNSENVFLNNSNNHSHVMVYALYQDGNKPIVFDGIINGKTLIETQTVPPSAPPMQISSLRTNTIDEDIICYNDTIVTSINPITYIYNWMVNKGGNEQSLTRVLMPFDTNSASLVKDYSGNNYNGTVTGTTWTNQGKVGGAYSFNGNGYISFPYCFSSSSIDKLTVETWIKTQADGVSIASFDRNKYWDLEIDDGKILWRTAADDQTTSITSNSNVNDNIWHLVTSTYDSSTGRSSIYLDGKLDVTEQTHGLGKVLGVGTITSGFIGKETNGARQTIFSTSFETQDEKNNWRENNSDAATDIYDYVDNNLSDVDRSSDKGTHSNFENEKNKDGIYDVLTEGNTAGTTTTTLLNDGFEASGSAWDDNWDGNGATSWQQSTSKVHGGSNSARSQHGNEGYLISDNLATNGATSITIDFWYYHTDISSNDLVLYFYDGSNWDSIASLGNSGSNNAWNHYQQTFTDTQYFKTNFRIRFYTTLGYGEIVYIDDVLITKEVPGVNYELDLEAQWTNVNYQLPNKELCIYTGSFSGSENIVVDIWTGSSWINVFNPLSPSQWNNVSITNWVTSPTFTIRYRDGTPTNDLTQNSWNIDATLLHLWTPKGVFDIFPSATLIPHSDSYSIGGSGVLYPDYDAYNRTGINISNYKNVTVSVWFSYKNTVNNDFLGLYYLNSTVWSPIFEINNPQIGGGQQFPWTHAEIQIPNSIHNLVLQFKWRTSAANEYVVIDDLNVTGILIEGGDNFTGIIDEFRIYDRVLSPEQIYQNYLCTKDGNSDQSVIVSEELVLGDIWRCIVTPNNSIIDDVSTESNSLQVVMYTGGGG